jgi:hypothetical protein
MTHDVDSPRIANATIAPEEHDEIEITPEMMEAGVREFLESRSLEYEGPEDAVESIFTAMVRVSPRRIR